MHREGDGGVARDGNRATDDADLLMPPPESKKSLTPEEKQTLKDWIAAGDFTLSEPAQPLPGPGSGIVLKGLHERLKRH